jgi:hypothetical protein
MRPAESTNVHRRERTPKFVTELGPRASRGRRDTMPPGQADTARLVALADELTPPSFAGYLDVAVHEGMPPGELDASARSPHWNRVRCSSGFGNVDLYVASRHYFGRHALNVLELPAHVIALHYFGHQGGGELVRSTYGHPDAGLARERVREAFRAAPVLPVPLAVSGR